jgi:hypothetical protein
MQGMQNKSLRPQACAAHIIMIPILFRNSMLQWLTETLRDLFSYLLAMD